MHNRGVGAVIKSVFAIEGCSESKNMSVLKVVGICLSGSIMIWEAVRNNDIKKHTKIYEVSKLASSSLDVRVVT